MNDGTTQALNPLLSIWTRPRATIQQIVDTELEQRVVALAALSGMTSALDNAGGRSIGDSLPLPAVFAIVLLIGPLAGLIGVYLWAWLLRWTGRWLGGVATLPQLRTAIAWGSVPLIAAGVPMVLALCIAGTEYFSEITPRLDQQPVQAMAVGGLTIVQGVLALWSGVTTVKTVAQVQGFSAWRALGNNLLPLLLIAVVGVAAAVLVPIMSR